MHHSLKSLEIGVLWSAYQSMVVFGGSCSEWCFEVAWEMRSLILKRFLLPIFLKTHASKRLDPPIQLFHLACTRLKRTPRAKKVGITITTSPCRSPCPARDRLGVSKNHPKRWVLEAVNSFQKAFFGFTVQHTLIVVLNSQWLLIFFAFSYSNPVSRPNSKTYCACYFSFTENLPELRFSLSLYCLSYFSSLQNLS